MYPSFELGGQRKETESCPVFKVSGRQYDECRFDQATSSRAEEGNKRKTSLHITSHCLWLTSRQQKMQNKKVNALRDQQVKSGLYAIDIGLVNMNEDRSLTDREGRYIAPAPPATKRVERDVKFGTPRAKRHKHDADQDEVTELVETSEPHQPVDFNEESAPPWWEWCRRAQEREAMTSQAHMSSSDTSGNASVFVEGLGILPFGPSSPHQLGGNDTLVTCRSSDQGLAPEHNEQPGDDGRLGRRAV